MEITRPIERRVLAPRLAYNGGLRNICDHAGLVCDIADISRR